MGLLAHIDSPADLKRLPLHVLPLLADEIRDEILDVCSRRGGHLAPSLGVVELTIALHYVYDAPRDRIIWDVGHQSYAHKLLTGRRQQFATMRTLKGISGFPRRSESPYDAFGTGHSSTSISAGLGFAVGGELRGERSKTVAVIGDGSLVAGMALEAINNLGHLKKDMIVVLNDNEMSIGKTEGAIATYLNRMLTGRFYNQIRADAWNLLGVLPANLSAHAREAARRIEEGMKNLLVPGVIFDDLGLRYLGPVDGHNILSLVRLFQRTRVLSIPLFIHVVTQKGRGYPPAEKDSEPFHGIGPFDRATGRPRAAEARTFTSAFGTALVERARTDPRVVAITAGMRLGTGLAEFHRLFPSRFFDVGINEQHAVTFAAGLAAQGLRPVVAVYATFLQRAYDQLIHDVCLQRLPVIFAIDRAGLVGEDGPTHHGPFDIASLRAIPDLVLMAPKHEDELAAMLDFALRYDAGPVALRYPRGASSCPDLPAGPPIELGRFEILTPGRGVALLGVGAAVGAVVAAGRQLAAAGQHPTLVNVRFVKPLDQSAVLDLARRHRTLVTVEEGARAGGFGSAVLEILSDAGVARPVIRLGLPDAFVAQGRRAELLELCGISAARILQCLAD